MAFRLLATAIVIGLLSSPGPARAQLPTVVARESTMTATVEKIEPFTRVVIFRSEGDVLQSVYVDRKVKAFDELKVGDVVTVRYVESVVVQVRPEARPAVVRDTTEQARTAGDENVVQQLTMVVTIESVDQQGLVVTYVTGDNRRVMRSVGDRRLLEGVHPGDRVEVTMTRERVVSIERGPR